MTGSPEAVGDTAVQRAIEDAVKEFSSTANMIMAMPEYAAARGATELAWRTDRSESLHKWILSNNWTERVS